MKKIFTLIAAALMAVGANAQGTYALGEGVTPEVGSTVTSVAGIKLTYVDPNNAGYNTTKAQTNWADDTFTFYTSATSTNGKYAAGAAPKGSYYQFDTESAGTLTVAIQLNGNKGFFIQDKDYNLVTYTYNLPAAAGAESQTVTKNDKDQDIVEEKTNGTLTFNVVAGGTYYVYCTGSKLGFFGFKYTTGGTDGISNINASAAVANAPIYNLAGQQVTGDYKGVVIQNGKKFILK